MTTYAYAAVTTTESDYPAGVRAQTAITRTKAPDVAQTTTRRVNSQGQVIAVVDAANALTQYTFDAFGNLAKVRSPTSTVAGTPIVQMGYDLRGRRTSLSDPDLGNWTYTYNGVGELKTQTDARAFQTSFAYDPLGRPTQRVENGPQGAFTTTWTYDENCAGGTLSARGQACQVAVAGGATKRLYHDPQGRPQRTATTIGSKTYNSYTLYDAYGRLRYVGYPESVPGYVYGVYRDYNASGYVSALTDSANRTLWQPLSRYADGQLYQSRLGGTGVITSRNYDVASL